MNIRRVLPFLFFLFFLICGSMPGVVPVASAQLSFTSSATTTGVTMTFNEPVLTGGGAGSIEVAFVLTDSSLNIVTGSFNTAGNPTIIFNAALVSGATYNISITGLVAQNGIDTLTTTATVTVGGAGGFSVLSTVPADGTTNVVPNIIVQANFSSPAAAASVNTSTFTLVSSTGPVAGTVTLSGSGTVASFTPTKQLQTNTQYTATITTGVTDTSGTPLQTPTTWSFTTGSSTFEKSGVKCFIATAAYGSYLDPHVKILRDFRDQYLLTNPAGSAFVSFYYEYSPPVADFISRHEPLRTATRWMLTPLVFVAEYPYVLFGLIGGAAGLFARKRRRKHE